MKLKDWNTYQNLLDNIQSIFQLVIVQKRKDESRCEIAQKFSMGGKKQDKGQDSGDVLSCGGKGKEQKRDR